MAPNGSIIDDDPHRIAYENAIAWQKLESSEQAAAKVNYENDRTQNPRHVHIFGYGHRRWRIRIGWHPRLEGGSARRDRRIVAGARTVGARVR